VSGQGNLRLVAIGNAYSYNNAFRITGITDTDNAALSQTYGYDALDRLTRARLSDRAPG
jgi:YD repeat-containing protein